MESKEFRLTIDANIHGEDVIDVLEKIAKHFQARADSLQYGDLTPLPHTFGYGSQVRLVPVQRKVIEEVIEGDDALAGDSSTV